MNNIITKKISNVIVKPIPKKNIPTDKILGYAAIPMLYCILFLCAFKNSGKTTLINTIMSHCIDKNTQVIVFSGTHDVDNSWYHIKKWLDKEDIQSHFYNSIYEDGVDQIPILMNHMKTVTEAEKEAELEAKKKKPRNYMLELMHLEDNSATIRVKKPKMISPKFLIVFDDVSNELNSKDVSFLLKTMRHYKSKIIISSQYLNDLERSGREQVDFWILFKGQSMKKVAEVYDHTGVRMEFHAFYQLYQEVTNMQHTFIMIDKNTGKLYKNFNEEIIIS